MAKTLAALIIIWLAQTSMCFSSTSQTIITRQNQADFGTKLTVKVFLNENTGRYIFRVLVPSNDRLIVQPHNFFLILSTDADPSVNDLSAPLRMASHTDGTTSAEFSLASHLIPSAYIIIEHQGKLKAISSASEVVYLKVSTYMDKDGK